MLVCMLAFLSVKPSINNVVRCVCMNIAERQISSFSNSFSYVMSTQIQESQPQILQKAAWYEFNASWWST